MSEFPEVRWDEIHRAAAAIVVYVMRWDLSLNPEDCEAIAVSALTAARSDWSTTQIYERTATYIESFERNLP